MPLPGVGPPAAGPHGIGALPERARIALVFVAATGLAFFVFGGTRGLGGRAPQSPEAAVPRDAYLVASLRMTELRRSPLYEVVLGKESAVPVLDRKALGIARLADACGFDPLARVSELAIAVPEEGDKGELGVAAHVDVTTDELERCAGALADQHGGKAETKEQGHFVVVEDGRSAEPGRPRIAYGQGGLLVAGRGAWFDAMLAAAEGARPSLRQAESGPPSPPASHAALRASMTGREGWHRPDVVVTAILPRSVRDRIRAEMAGEIEKDGKDGTDGRGNDAGDATGASRGRELMTGVLGVSAVGVAVLAGQAGKDVEAAAELVCDTDNDCAAVEKLILKKRLDWSKTLMFRMIGLGPLLDSITVRRESLRVRVTAKTGADALAATIDRVLRLSGDGPSRGTRREPRTAPKAEPR
jgi:hypothetical protein